MEVCRAFGYQQVFFYGIDEATRHLLTSQRTAWETVREAGGRMFAAARGDAIHTMSDLLGVAVRSYLPDPEEATKWHAVGAQVLAYGNPQSGVEEPATYRRNFGLVLWDAGYDGAMEFSYNCPFGHGWNDFDSMQYRDHNFVDFTIDGGVDTLQWEGFREAIDDVRYVTTLEQAIASAPPGKAPVAEQAKRWLAGLSFSSDPRGHQVPLTCLDDDVVHEWMQNLDPETADLDRVREKIVAWILKLRE